MSARARFFLLIMLVHNLGGGLACLFFARNFTAHAYDFVHKATPMWVPGLLMVGIAALTIAALIADETHTARWAINCSAAVTTAWAFAFFVALLTRPVDSPMLPFFVSALALKDWAVSGMHLEDVISLGKEDGLLHVKA